MDEQHRAQRRQGRTTQVWRRFLHEVAQACGVEVAQAERAAIYSLEVLESRLLKAESDDLNAQLPTGLVELLPLPPERPERLHRADFLQRIAELLEVDDHEAERLCRGVYEVISRRVSEGELEDVLREMPAELRTLWPAQLVAEVARHEGQDRFRAERERGEHLPS